MIAQTKNMNIIKDKWICKKCKLEFPYDCKCYITSDLSSLKEYKNNKPIKMLFVMSGTDKIRKGVIYLEKALPTLFKKHNNLVLIHIGNIFKWNIPEKYKYRIIQVGKIKYKNMIDYYQTSNFLIHTSLQEGFPNTIIEAMASELLVCSSDIDGIHEYIEHKKSGYIFKRGNSKEITKAINWIIDN